MQTVPPSAQSDAVDDSLFKSIVDQAPEAIVFADTGGVIRVWNAGAQALFGFDRAEAVGNSLDLIIPERFRRAHWDAFDKAIANGHTRLGSQDRTTRSLHKDGRKLYVDLSFGLVADAAGTVIGALAVGRDGTGRYLEERALREKLATLEHPAPRAP
jgi:PAS domain S-box-containing protein